MIRIREKAKAFTLIEILIAVFTFVIISLVILKVSTTSLASYNKVKYLNSNLRFAQNAMNSMTKTFRTSKIAGSVPSISPGNSGIVSSLRVYDYSQKKCIIYEFVSSSKSIQFAYADLIDPPPADELAWCEDNSDITEFKQIVNSVSSGNFYIVRQSDNVEGKITISMQLQAGITSPISPIKVGDIARIQSTVSLRDYQEVGL